MPFSNDIIERINSDFGEKRNEATKALTDAGNKVDELKGDRIIRCLIYLAKGDLSDLNNYIESAINDTRDVIFWAEYSGIKEFKTPRLVRDFSKTFDESIIDPN